MNDHWIDLRSDTVTRPTAAMRQAMASAEVGDDVFGEDPTVCALQERVAALLEKERALYVPSGCMSNQLAVKAHTESGDEIMCEEDAHIFNYETAAPAVLSAVQVKTIKGVRGAITVEQLRRAIRPKLYYMPRSRLVCLENTHNRAGGTIYPLEEIKAISAFAKEVGLMLHLDGARLWNACAATGISPAEYARYFDSVSVCFSKGLGAPVGSTLVGSAQFIERAHKWRKVIGGGMRQAGIIAAGALYALDHHRDRLHEDHEKAEYFAKAVSSCTGFSIDLESVQTNIVIVNVVKTGKTPDQVIQLLRSKGILVSAGTMESIRAVMHLDVSLEQVRSAADTILQIFHY
ncbi:MAG: low-specificity L-threonine aldolase [Ignavibacteriales bacterium]|nr:low-specificity L-threonine aldolase [Ignavibacteriales bacterium]